MCIFALKLSRFSLAPSATSFVSDLQPGHSAPALRELGRLLRVSSREGHVGQRTFEPTSLVHH
jgi:hypothetical protein